MAGREGGQATLGAGRFSARGSSQAAVHHKEARKRGAAHQRRFNAASSRGARRLSSGLAGASSSGRPVAATQSLVGAAALQWLTAAAVDSAGTGSSCNHGSSFRQPDGARQRRSSKERSTETQ
ncbi:hypothetical protein VPH35_015047 [Triticum aestivum]